ALPARSQPYQSRPAPRVPPGQSSREADMKFHDLLIEAIGRSEIPLRFEPGAEEAVAKPIAELLEAWITAHLADDAATEFERGRRSLAVQLLAEVGGAVGLPVVAP